MQATIPRPRGQGRLPQNWAKPIGRDITTAFKGVSEIIARFAEPVMRYATIYLALSTALPVLNFGPLYAIAMIVVIASPEFVLVGALSVAETAMKEKQGFWGFVLFVVCAALAIIMVTTFVDIFIVAFNPVAIKALNFARCLTAVGFSIALNKLESNEETVQPNQASLLPDINQLLIEQRTSILAEMEANLREWYTRIVAEMPQVEAPDHARLAQHIQPLLMPVFAQFTTSFREEIEAHIGHSQIQIDLTELASQLLPMLQACNASEEECATSVATDNATDLPRITAKLPELHMQQTRNTDKLKPATNSLRKRETSGSEKAAKMQRIVKRNPTISPTELAAKVGVSPSTASRFKTKFFKGGEQA